MGNMELNVAILGATGMVGREFIRVLEQRRFPAKSVRLLASARSAGKQLSVLGSEVSVEEAGPLSFEGIDIALFSAGGEASRHFAPIAARSGAVVVDNSSAWRMDPQVPLVVPEVNPDDIRLHRGIIANPNCSTIQMVVALFPLHRVNPIRRIVVDTYQAVSGTGAAALEELRVQARQVLEGQAAVPHVYPHQIAFNVLPEIDVFLDNGYTREERKMLDETRKIMHAPEVGVSATCVRVPVMVGHSEAVHADQPVERHVGRKVLAEVSHGVERVVRPGLVDLPVAHVELRVARHGQSAHLEAVGRGCQRAVWFVRWTGAGYQRDALNADLLGDVPGDDQVSQVDRVE